MSTVPPDRRVGAIPRTVPHDCKECGGQAPVFNGAYFRRLRELAKLSLMDMVRIARASGMDASKSHLSRMEIGEYPFAPEYASLYDRLFERRRKAGYLDED